MVDTNPLEEKLIKNEQIIRDRNTKAGNGIQRYLREDDNAMNSPLSFVCECSTIDCDRHVTMSITTYQTLHRRNDRFAVHPGHDTPSVEKIIKRHDDYDIVEKYKLDS